MLEVIKDLGHIGKQGSFVFNNLHDSENCEAHNGVQALV